MHSALTPSVSAGVALISAGLIAAVPSGPQPTAPRPEAATRDTAVELTASSVANIPANLIEAIASIPANEIKALQALADALNYGGSWWAFHPLNVLGFDPADPPKISALASVLVPIPALAGPLGDQLNIFLQSQLPMNAGCVAVPYPCDDPLALAGGFFQVSLMQLLAGYTFPTIVNPVPWPDNTADEVPWSGLSVRLDLLAPLVSLVESLMEEPSGIEIVTAAQVGRTIIDLLLAANVAFNPYVPGSNALDPTKTVLLDRLLTALEPLLGWTAPDPDVAIPGPDDELPQTPVDTIVLPPLPTWTNIPANVVNTILSVPANEVLALHQLADSLFASGSWGTYTATHLEGFDPQDVLKLAALVNVLVPMPALSVPLGEQLNILATAEIPTNQGCSGLIAPCDDPAALYLNYFRVPIWDLLNGYTFPLPTPEDTHLVNPVDGSVMPWAGQTVTLEPFAPVQSALESLTAPPTEVTTVTPEQVASVVPRLADALWVSFNPLTPGSILFGPPWPVPLDVTWPQWLPKPDFVDAAAIATQDADFDVLEQDSTQAALAEESIDETAEDSVDGIDTEMGVEGLDETDGQELTGRHSSGIPALDLIESVTGSGDVDASSDRDGEETDLRPRAGAHRLVDEVRSVRDRFRSALRGPASGADAEAADAESGSSADDADAGSDDSDNTPSGGSNTDDDSRGDGSDSDD